jgi:hypothetical protein
VQLQKSRQACFVAPWKKFFIAKIFVARHTEVTSNPISDISDKTGRVLLHFYVFGFYLPLVNKCVHLLRFAKLLLKHSVLLERSHSGDETRGSRSKYGGWEIHKSLVGEPVRKDPYRKPGRGWGDNTQMDFKEIG